MWRLISTLKSHHQAIYELYYYRYCASCSSAQIWDPKNVYMIKILQNKLSILLYNSISSVIFYLYKHFCDPKFVHCYMMYLH